MLRLTREQCSEIYYALETKIFHLNQGYLGETVEGDVNVEEWAEDLQKLAELVGKDGETLYEELNPAVTRVEDTIPGLVILENLKTCPKCESTDFKVIYEQELWSEEYFSTVVRDDNSPESGWDGKWEDLEYGGRTIHHIECGSCKTDVFGKDPFEQEEE